MRNNYVIVGVVDFYHLHFHFLTYIDVEISDRLHVNLRTRQKGFNTVDVYNQTTLSSTLH